MKNEKNRLDNNFIKNIFRIIFGYRCDECGGLGIVAYFNADSSGCSNCNGKGRMWKRKKESYC